VSVADIARITVHRDALRQTVLLEEFGNGSDDRFGRKVCTNLRVNQNRGANIHCVEHLDNMLAFAKWVRRDVRYDLAMSITLTLRAVCLPGD
jgi:hypothetical protein